MKKLLKKTAATLLALTLSAAALTACGSSADTAAAASATASAGSTAETSGENELEKVKAAGKLVIGVEGTYRNAHQPDDECHRHPGCR